MKEGQLTVSQLIEKLQTMPQDLPLSEGCDCNGEACSVHIVDGSEWTERSVLISRDDS